MHNHTDTARLTAGCPACTAIVSADQAAAALAAAPMRRCQWVCRFLNTNPADGALIDEVSFTLVVRVPEGWTSSRLADQYAGLTSIAFAQHLPAATFPASAVDAAMETMEVLEIVIGQTVPEPALAVPAALDMALFELDVAS